MPAIEITATFCGERFRFPNGDGDIVIGNAEHVDGELPEDLSPEMSYGVKGPDDESRPLRQSGTYRFFGQWKMYSHPRNGTRERQFHFTTYVEAEPATRSGIVAYLAEAGRGNGIGLGRAAKIWERWGCDAVRMVREQPDDVAATITGLGVESARLVAERLRERAHIEHCSIELMGLLDRRGMPKATAKKALALWGNQATDMIRRNPYLLMRFRGIGFKTADAMYLDLGHKPERLKRQALCAWYAIASDTSGHTWYPVATGVNAVRGSISASNQRPGDALRLAKRSGMIDILRTDRSGRIEEKGESIWMAERKCSANESYIARRLVDSENYPVFWPDTATLENITAHQAEQLSVALRGVIGVFGGGPGTGKTYAAAALVRALVAAGSGNKVGICAPTGKAAVRMSEALQTYGINKRATTIHSMLGVESGDGGWSFRHNESNPLPFRFILVDESSMIDCDLMSSLVAAVARGTHVLFVGDVNQLPPVGHGAPLRDMISAKLPYGELTELHRNSGGIVEACRRIRCNQKFECTDNLELLEAFDPAAQLRACLEACERTRLAGMDPVWDCQVVVPVNAKSKVSRRELNKVLQAELNANPGTPGSPFRTGDKIVNTRNGYYTAIEFDGTDVDLTRNDKGEVYVANGELGRVLEAAASHTIVQLSSPDRIVRVPRGNAESSDSGSDDESAAPTTGCAWDLGYALSVHKSQGSEWPVVAVVLDEYPGARMVSTREWTYTAISRAKQRCYLIGKLATAHQFCRRKQINERTTFLVERCGRERAAKLLAQI